MDNNQIIKYDNGQLTKLGNTIAITNKLLEINNHKTIQIKPILKNSKLSPEQQKEALLKGAMLLKKHNKFIISNE